MILCLVVFEIGVPCRAETMVLARGGIGGVLLAWRHMEEGTSQTRTVPSSEADSSHLASALMWRSVMRSLWPRNWRTLLTASTSYLPKADAYSGSSSEVVSVLLGLQDSLQQGEIPLQSHEAVLLKCNAFSPLACGVLYMANRCKERESLLSSRSNPPQEFQSLSVGFEGES